MGYGPRAGVRTWSVLVLTAVSVLIPVAWTAGAPLMSRPSARLNAETAPTPVTVTVSGKPASRLFDQIDTLPIVVDDLPDQSSHQAATTYKTLTVGDPSLAAKVFQQSWQGLTVGGAVAPQVQRFGAQLLASPGRDTPSALPDEGDAFLGRLNPITGALTSDPRNADRLSNAAVGLFILGVSEQQDPFSYLSTDYVHRAKWLLQGAVDAFPSSRPARLNLAFVTSVDSEGCGPQETEIEAAAAALMPWLAQHPDDVTARVMEASFQSRNILKVSASRSFVTPEQVDGLGDAIRTLQPLLRKPQTAALGEAMLGDAFLAAADAVGGQAPYLARAYERIGLDHYVRALGGAGDPGLLTGESTALGLLGYVEGALAAQGAAVKLSPDSPELLLELAGQEQRTGEFAAVRQTAERALAWTVANPMVQASKARFITAAPIANDSGYLGLSVGSDRLRVVVPRSARGCGGGGFTTLADSIPIPPSDDPNVSQSRRWDPLPDASLELALAASTVLGDVNQAKADLDRWEQLLSGGPKNGLSDTWATRDKNLASFASAPVLVTAGVSSGGERPTGTTFGSAFHFAESRLRQAGAETGQSRLFTLASAVCQRAASADPSLASQAEQCQAESEYYAGHAGTAEAMLQGLAQKTDNSVDPVVGIEAAFAAWKAKDLDRSKLLFQQAVDLWSRAPSDGEVNFALANELFGEYLLDQSQPSSATGYLRAALSSAVHALAKHDYIDKRQGGLIGRAVIEHAANNLGIDLLWLAKQGAESIPDCGRQKSTCLDARGNFETALSIDPSDPTVLLNLGWVQRLLGDTRASQIALTRAVEIDSRDYPALNDLGWLAAGGGEHSVAQRALEQALTVRPDDDIAAWNLGILSLQSGPWGIPLGEAYLARAIRENHKLREEPFGYRTDERIYRQSYGTTIEPVTTRELDMRLGGGALALGTVGALASVASGTGVELENQLVEMLGERKLPGADTVANWLRSWRRRRQKASSSSGRRLVSVGRWAFSGALITAIAIWSAWPESESARASVLILALVGTGLALLVHEAGHLAAACFAGVKFLPVWPGRAAVISVAMLPLGISDGPFPGHTAAPGTPFERAKGVYFAGLMANLAVGILFYGLYLIQPMPALRLFAELQLSVAAFSVLPLRPLDAAAFRRHRESALLLAPFAFLVVVAGLLFRAKVL